jgi:hypothetical protein
MADGRAGRASRRRHRFGAVDQTVATLLGAIWLVAGLASILLGITYARWPAIVLGSGALWYASLWLRVAARRRLFTWSELAFPWRTRKRADQADPS